MGEESVLNRIFWDMTVLTLAGNPEEYSRMRSTFISLVLFPPFPSSHSITHKTSVGGGYLSASTNSFLLFLLLDMFVLLALVLPFKAPSWESRPLG